MPAPIITEAAFVDAHNHWRTAIRDAILSPSRKNPFEWRWLAEQIDPRCALFRQANNPTARIESMRIARGYVEEIARAARGQSLFFVTLAPAKFAIPLSQAAEFDPKRLMGWIAQAIPGHNFIGMIEMGFYENVKHPQSEERLVSWHAHLILWTRKPNRLKRQRTQINSTNACLVPGLTVAHLRSIPIAEIEAKLTYMMKAPMDRTKIYPRKREAIDAATGEILSVETGRFVQKSERLNGIALLRVCKAMKDFLIDRLLVAGGDGKSIGTAMRNDLRSALKRYEEGRGNRPYLRGRANWLPR